MTRSQQNFQTSGCSIDRIVDASSPSVVAAYEKRIEKLEREKLLLAEKASQCVPPPGRLEEVIEPALAFSQTLDI